MAKPPPTHPIAWFLLRRLVGLKRAAARLCPLLWLRLVFTLVGFLGHLAPWLVIRTVTLWIPAPGDFSPAVNRLLWGLPVYGFWCGLSAFWVREFCLVWGVVVWLALLLLGGLLALGQTQLWQQLRVRYHLPPALGLTLGTASLLVGASCAGALLYVSPIELLRGNAPDFSQLEAAALDERLSADEHTLAAVLAELAGENAPRADAQSEPAAEWETPAFQARQARLLRYHTTLRRLAWTHQNQARLGDENGRRRAAKLQRSAATAARDLAHRWHPLFDPAGQADLATPLAPREPRHGVALLTPEWMEKLRPFLQPGDIVLTQANPYLATGLLPGKWSQLGLYVGTSEQLQAAGLDQELSIQQRLETFAPPNASGQRQALIQAAGQGVAMASLEQTLGAADSVAVLRPKLSPVQRQAVIARAFAWLGTPYDYDFDFTHEDKLFCSELVARALAGFMDFPLDTVAGRPVLTGDGLVRFWAAGEGGPQLQFVAYVAGDEANGECNWASPGELAEGARVGER